MAAFLDDTRRRSVLGRAVLLVRCDPEQRQLAVDGAKDAGVDVKPFPEAVSEVSCSPGQMRYLPQGSADGMELVLRDARGRQRRLTVGAFTGLTRVDAGP